MINLEILLTNFQNNYEEMNKNKYNNFHYYTKIKLNKKVFAILLF